MTEIKAEFIRLMAQAVGIEYKIRVVFIFTPASLEDITDLDTRIKNVRIGKIY